MAGPYRGGLTQWRVCRTCLGLYEVRRSRGQPQLCRCRRRADEPTWDRFDFNERAHLCECCLGVVLESGSKFSVWFCAECKERIMGFNARFGRTVIPIGRHSLMASVSLGGPGLLEWAEGKDPAGDASVEAFRIRVRGLFDSIDHLHAWSHGTLGDSLRELTLDGADVQLTRYLRVVRDAGSTDERSRKLVAFQGLCAHFEEPPGG
jgi:hypothetical protein